MTSQGMMRAMTVATLGVAVLVGGCERSVEVPTTPGAARNSSGSAGSDAAASASAVAAVATAACRATDLTVTAGTVDAGAGQRYLPVIFHNKGTAPCRLQGFPGVAGLDAKGKQIIEADRETGFTPVAVVLGPGDVAAAVVHAGAVPVNAESCPPDYAGLLVTVPGDSGTVRLAVGLPSCAGLTVRPVRAGEAGV